MKIINHLKGNKPGVSCELFPPKQGSQLDNALEIVRAIAAQRPSFISVTYGAGGGTSEFTVDIADNLQRNYGITMLPHLTCVSSTREHVATMVRKFQERGLENIMALRGDIPDGGSPSQDYHYAYELIQDIKRQGDFCLGGACYPEGHPDTPHKVDDIAHLKDKVDAGLSFLTTQMFFDNNIFYNFLYRIRERGITVPVLAGIMPITNARQVERAIHLSASNVPQRFRAMVDHFGDRPGAMKQAGIVYASDQIIDLVANGVKHIHVYTMNKPEIAAGILNNLSEIWK